jgi:hypothetical protein
MKAKWSLGALFAICTTLVLANPAEPQSTSNSLLVAPAVTSSAPLVAPVRPVVDDFFGTKVSDPYRSMENQDHEEVQAWMRAQDSHTRSVLDEIPGRKQLLEHIRNSISPCRGSSPGNCPAASTFCGK